MQTLYKNSAVSLTPLTNGGRFQWHRWQEVGGVNDTAERWWAVSMTLLTKIDTADQGTSKFSMLWLLLKGIPIEESYIGKLYYSILYLQHSYKKYGG
jgi:hypothetical protein